MEHLRNKYNRLKFNGYFYVAREGADGSFGAVADGRVKNKRPAVGHALSELHLYGYLNPGEIFTDLPVSSPFHNFSTCCAMFCG
jgi:hypothetical protein